MENIPAPIIARFTAYFADGLIFSIPVFILNYFIIEPLNNWLISVCFLLVATMLYYVGFTFYNAGQTPGKYFKNIKVVSQKGALTFSQIVLRYVCFLIMVFIPDIMGLIIFSFFIKASDETINLVDSLIVIAFYIFIIGFITINKRHLGPHDIAAKTIVVKV